MYIVVHNYKHYSLCSFLCWVSLSDQIISLDMRLIRFGNMQIVPGKSILYLVIKDANVHYTKTNSISVVFAWFLKS